MRTGHKSAKNTTIQHTMADQGNIPAWKSPECPQSDNAGGFLNPSRGGGGGGGGGRSAVRALAV